MKDSDDFWGDMFDFDGDGKTSLDEEILGLGMIFNLMEEEEDKEETFGSPVRRRKRSPGMKTGVPLKREEKPDTHENTEPITKQKWILVSVLVLLLLSLLILAKYHIEKQISYDSAIELINEGQFEKAQTILNDMSDYYKDAKLLSEYCTVCLCYEEGLYSDAALYLTPEVQGAAARNDIAGHRELAMNIALHTQ